MMNLSNISNLLAQKYVISPLDGNQYCRANGYFKRHLHDNGFNSYHEFFRSMYPTLIQHCKFCGVECSFNDTTMQYKNTCGDRKCQGKLTSEILASRDDNYWPTVLSRRYETISSQPIEYKRKIIEKRVAECIARGSYQKAVAVREQTCLLRYGDSKYNNSTQISKSKLNWTPERKALYHERFLQTTGGKKLYEFHTTETWYNRSIRLHERGLAVHPDERSALRLYRLAVQRLTEQNYKQHKHIINPNNYTRATKKDCELAYHLDHIIPIVYGFAHNIPVDTIASVDNLQMLHYKENISKGAKYVSI